MNNNFRVILAKQKKSLKDVHEVTHLSMTTLSGIYSEKTANPEFKTLLKIANYLNVSIDELLGTMTAKQGE